MKKIAIAIFTLSVLALSSCTKSRDCVCTIEGEEFTFVIEGTKKASTTICEGKGYTEKDSEGETVEGLDCELK